MTGLARTFERFLRLDRLQSKSDIMRARAVYIIGLAFVATQFINQLAMSFVHGQVTLDHFISIQACVFTLAIIFYLRRNTSFAVFAVFFSVLVVGGIFAAALPERTGINSALLPFFVLGILGNGLLCGWRATVAFGAVTLCCVWALFHVSLVADGFSVAIFDRAVQASLAAITITLIIAIFSTNMHDAFDELEHGIEAARASDAAKTDFLATMSHELFTPLNGVVALTDVLAETDSTPISGTSPTPSAPAPATCTPSCRACCCSASWRRAASFWTTPRWTRARPSPAWFATSPPPRRPRASPCTCKPAGCRTACAATRCACARSSTR